MAEAASHESGAVPKEQDNVEAKVEEQDLDASAEVPAVAVEATKTARASSGSSSAPLGFALVALGASAIGAAVSYIVRKRRSQAKPSTAAEPVPAVESVAEPSAVPVKPASAVPQPVDLSPFGSPVGSTPVKVLTGTRRDQLKSASVSSTPSKLRTTSVDDDDRSDRDSLRDQRQAQLVDPAQLKATLKQMQDMQEENKKLQAFLAEFKADTEKISKLERENQELRSVTRVLEQELTEIKAAARPLVSSGAELESFKSSIHVPTVARSTCSHDDALGLSSASVDGNMDATRRRTNVLKQLLASMTNLTTTAPSTAASTPRNSLPPTPRGTGSSAAAAAAGSSGAGGAGAKLSGAKGRKPAPAEAAALGQAVYQLLDTFGGGMML